MRYDPRLAYATGILGVVAGVTGEIAGLSTMAWIGWAVAVAGLLAGFVADRR